MAVALLAERSRCVNEHKTTTENSSKMYKHKNRIKTVKLLPLQLQTDHHCHQQNVAQFKDSYSSAVDSNITETQHLQDVAPIETRKGLVIVWRDLESILSKLGRVFIKYLVLSDWPQDRILMRSDMI